MANDLARAYRKTLKALELDAVDSAVAATGLAVAKHIDQVIAEGDSGAITKAFYLVPHLMNVLKELGATPAARGALAAMADAGASAAKAGVSSLDAFRAEMLAAAKRAE